MTTHAQNPGPIAPGEYHVDPKQTRVSFRTRHMFGLGPVHGTFAALGGTVTLGDDATADVEIDAGSFATDSETRDRAVRGATKMLNIETYPTIGIHISSIESRAEGYRAHGTMTAHGRTAPLEADVDAVELKDSVARARITARVDRFAHGITGYRGMAARWLDVTVELAAIRTDAAA